jgi:histidyl-tRNA synthetase
VPEDQRHAFIQAIDKSEREPREKTAEKLGPLANEIFAILADAASAKSDRLDTVETGLRHRGLQDYVKRDYTVVRGLAYYTGVVFEAFDRTGEFRAIAGGGRYDTLLKNLGDVDLPALGFGMGDVVLGEILKSRSPNSSTNGLNLYVSIMNNDYRGEVMRLISRCREAGLSTDFPFRPGSWGKQADTAQEKGAAYLCVVGDLMKDGNKVQVRNLATRTDETMILDDVPGYVGSMLGIRLGNPVNPVNPV